MNVSKNVVVISGGTAGIGKAIAERFLKESYIVIICSRTEPTRLSGQFDDENLIYVELDLTKDQSIRECARKIHEISSKVDVLINCAGTAIGGHFLMSTIETIRGQFDVNYFGTLLFTQYITRRMVKYKSGSIVNIVSMAGILANEGTLSYGGSKAALIHATKVMSAELGNFGIRVNAVAPGVVETGMADKMERSARERAYSVRALRNTKIYANDVSELAYFLGSKSSSKISGQIICIDGGLLI